MFSSFLVVSQIVTATDLYFDLFCFLQKNNLKKEIKNAYINTSFVPHCRNKHWYCGRGFITWELKLVYSQNHGIVNYVRAIDSFESFKLLLHYL